MTNKKVVVVLEQKKKSRSQKNRLKVLNNYL